MISKDRDHFNDSTNNNLEGRPQAKGLLHLFYHRPVASALGIFILDSVLVILASIAATTFAPSILKTAGGPGLPDFLAVCFATLITVIFVSVLGWWRLVGYNRPVAWRNLRLLLIPLAAVLLPLVAGFRAIDTPTVIFLLVGYLLTGIYEETLFRGVILRILGPKGVWPAVLISSVLFGLAHSTNLFLRFSGQPLMVGLQMFGAFTFGIGMAALRLRTNTIWPVIFLHTFGDLFLHLGRLPIPLMDAAHDVILLVYGLFLIRGLPGKQSVHRTSTPTAHEEPIASGKEVHASSQDTY